MSEGCLSTAQRTVSDTDKHMQDINEQKMIKEGEKHQTSLLRNFRRAGKNGFGVFIAKIQSSCYNEIRKKHKEN